ncbi:MAG: hypothetical protein ACOCSF_04280 [Halanaeroarchaeum sp.]
MRGAVVVGDVFGSVHEVSVAHLSVLGALGMAFLSPIAFGAFLWTRARNDPTDETETRQARKATADHR